MLDKAPALEGAEEGDVVGILEVPADRQPARDARHRSRVRREQVGEVHGGRLAFEVRVGGEDDLFHPAALDAGEELADAKALRTDAVDRADGAVEDMVAAAKLAGSL